MEITLSIKDETQENLIVGALEGGSNYWYYLGEEACNIIDEKCPAEKKDEPFSIRFWEAIKAGAVIPIHDAEDEDTKIGEISLESIQKGWDLLKTKQLRHFADILSENDDADTADVWFQFCSLGELVYG